MKNNLFHIVLVVLVIVLTSVSFYYKDGTEAMVAIVDSQVTAVSYEKPVIVKKISVVAGQEIKKGDLLVQVVRPDLALDLEQLESNVDRLKSEKSSNQSQFDLQNRLIKLRFQNEENKIRSELEELELDKSIKTVKQEAFSKIVKRDIQWLKEDSLFTVKVNGLQSKLSVNQSAYNQEVLLLKAQLDEKHSVLDQKLEFAEKEIISLKSEFSELNKYAKFEGTVGAVNVQLDELVPPFKTLISLYESKPSLIKAFMNEKISYEVEEDDSVWVKSERRNYKVPGIILEVGSRITSYPTKIEPFPNVTSYGQEVFVRIKPNNHFLNGEKVYVYPQEPK